MTAPPRTASTTRAPFDGRAVDSTMSAPDSSTDTTEQRFTLSATQVMASMAAAVTAALVGSRLGVAGTVIGAGLASVISVVGGAVIGHSILLTRKQVKRAVLQVRGTGRAGSTPEPASPATILLPAHQADDHTVVIPAVTRFDLERASRDARTGPGHAEPGRPYPTRRRVSTGVLLGVAAAVAIFVSSLGAVTVAETIKGSPLSGGAAGGLSVLGGGGGGGNDGTTPATTTTAVSTESATVTQTVTSEVTATTVPPTSSASAPSSSAPSSSAAPSGQASSSASSAALSPAGSAASASPDLDTPR